MRKKLLIFCFAACLTFSLFGNINDESGKAVKISDNFNSILTNIVSDEDNIYWIDNEKGIIRLDLNTNDKKTISQLKFSVSKIQLTEDSICCLTKDGKIIFANKDNGQISKTVNINLKNLKSFYVEGNNIFVLSQSGDFLLLDINSRVLSKGKAFGYFGSNICFFSNSLYFANLQGCIFSFNLKKKFLENIYIPNNYTPTLSNIAIYKGFLAIIGFDGIFKEMNCNENFFGNLFNNKKQERVIAIDKKTPDTELSFLSNAETTYISERSSLLQAEKIKRIDTLLDYVEWFAFCSKDIICCSDTKGQIFVYNLKQNKFISIIAENSDTHIKPMIIGEKILFFKQGVLYKCSLDSKNFNDPISVNMLIVYSVGGLVTLVIIIIFFFRNNKSKDFTKINVSDLYSKNDNNYNSDNSLYFSNSGKGTVYTPDFNNVIIDDDYALKSLVSPDTGIYSNSVGMDFVYIEPSVFEMGDKSERIKIDDKEYLDNFEDYSPIHIVKITKPYLISKFKVTQGQYQQIMFYNPNEIDKENTGSKEPVSNISWNEAVAFCKRLTDNEHMNKTLADEFYYRLATEIEWEFAAKGGVKSKEFIFSGSNELNEVSPVSDLQRESGISNIPSSNIDLKPNELNIYHMCGYLNEWCLDEFIPYKQFTVNDAILSDKRNNEKVLRGGNVFDYADACRITSRDCNSPNSKEIYYSFRIVLARKNNV